MGSIPSSICCNLIIDPILVLGPTFQSQTSEVSTGSFADSTSIHVGSLSLPACGRSLMRGEMLA